MNEEKAYLCQCGLSYATKKEARQCVDSHQCSHEEKRYELRMLRDGVTVAVWCCCKKCGKFINSAYLDELDWDEHQDILKQLYNRGRVHDAI